MNDSKEIGKQFVDKAIAGKIGHKVAIIGNEVFSGIKSEDLNGENFNVETYTVNDFHKINRLLSYSLCIVGYQAFSNALHQQQVFIKQMSEALENGVSFCFVFYNESALLNHGGPSFSELAQKQVASQVLDELKVAKPFHLQVTHEGKFKRNEFGNYLNKWGSSCIHFNGLDKNAEVIYESKEGHTLGFAISAKNGRVIYLPFFSDASNIVDTQNGLKSLIDSLLTYIAKSRIDLPPWAKESSFFSDEETLIEEKVSLQNALAKVDTDLQKFDEAKSILFHNEYQLEKTLPNFLKSHLDLEIEQNETYKEDFWIVDDKKEKLAIAEIKSKTKGFTKGLVGFLIAHRDYYELDDDFPSLLFVNCNLQAGSWKDKDKPLNEQEYKYVANQNVLVIRIEDVIRLWEMKRLGKITSEDILNLFLTKKGWLQVTPKLELKVHPK